MFHIITTDNVNLASTEKVRYIKINPRTGNYVLCKKEEAIGVALNGKRYNLLGHDDIPDVETVYVSEFDGAVLLEKLKKENKELKDQLADTDAAAILLYESNLAAQKQMNETDEAIIEIYELMEDSNNG